MKLRNILIIGLAAAAISCTSEKQEIHQVPFNEVTVTGGFWQQRMETELNTTVPFSLAHCDTAIERFEQAIAFLEGRSEELPETHRFISSDMYKVMEGAAYSLMLERNPEVEAKLDYMAEIIAEA